LAVVLNEENVSILRENKFYRTNFSYSNTLELKKKSISIFGQRTSFLQKSTKSVHVQEKLLALQFGTSNRF